MISNVILTCRFDILCVIKDVVDPVSDGKLGEFVVSSHIRSHPSAQVLHYKIPTNLSLAVVHLQSQQYGIGRHFLSSISEAALDKMDNGVPYPQDTILWPQAREAKAEETAQQQPSELDPDIIPQETLRKYIAYAKQNCHPKLQNADYDKISQACSSALSSPLSQIFNSIAAAIGRIPIISQQLPWHSLHAQT